MRVRYARALAAAQLVTLTQGFVLNPGQLISSQLGANFGGLGQSRTGNELYCCRAGHMSRGTESLTRRRIRRENSVASPHATVNPPPESTSFTSNAVISEVENSENAGKHCAGDARGDLLLLATVPLVWGTYAPSVKYMYDLGEEFSPPGLVFNLGSYLVSALTLTGAAWIYSARNLDGEHVPLVCKTYVKLMMPIKRLCTAFPLYI